MDPTLTTNVLQEMTTRDLTAQFGFAGLIFLAFMFLLRTTLKLKEKILNDAKEERIQWVALIQQFQKTLDTQGSDYRQYMLTITGAFNRFQDDHKTMFEIMEQCCLGLKELRKQFDDACINRQHEHERMIDILDEQQKVLARINGYKH